MAADAAGSGSTDIGAAAFGSSANRVGARGEISDSRSIFVRVETEFDQGGAGIASSTAVGIRLDRPDGILSDGGPIGATAGGGGEAAAVQVDGSGETIVETGSDFDGVLLSGTPSSTSAPSRRPAPSSGPLMPVLAP